MTNEAIMSALEEGVGGPITSPLVAADKLLNSAGRILRDEGSDCVEQVVQAAGLLYDRFVAPIDIPGIPNIVEPAFDAAVKQALIAGIRVIAKKIDDMIHDHE